MKKVFKTTGKFALAVAAMMLTNVQAHAQDVSKLTSGLNTLVSNIKNLFSSVTNVMYAIAAIIGIIGGIIVYSKFTNGDPNATKNAVAWGGAVLFLVLASTFLKTAFGM